MAIFATLFRRGLSRVPNQSTSSYIVLRTITSKTIRDLENRPRKSHYDYNHKSFNLLHYLFDKTTDRIDENSKVIIVEGTLACGKSVLAKALAKEFDMLYMPEANLDMLFINKYGYDLRQLDDQMPEAARSFDVNNFMRVPNHVNAAAFQYNQYMVKFSQYIDALAHVLSTGQGVVLDRSFYSDFAFAEAMNKSGYMSKPALDVYYELRQNSINLMLRPHLIIYLDVPAPNVIKAVKQRNISYEVNSPVINEKYLDDLRTAHMKYLNDMRRHCNILVYDWQIGTDHEIVAEDVERLSFEFEEHHKKFRDWDFFDEEEWYLARNEYADKKGNLMSYFNIPAYWVPELVIKADDYWDSQEILEQAPGERYEYGYNSDMGDKGILFKFKTQERDTLPLRERRIEY